MILAVVCPELWASDVHLNCSNLGIGADEMHKLGGIPNGVPCKAHTRSSYTAKHSCRQVVLLPRSNRSSTVAPLNVGDQRQEG